MEATNNLNAINQIGGETGTPNKPWQLTFSFGAELETNVLEIWRGSGENAAAAQKAFMHRCKVIRLCNHLQPNYFRFRQILKLSKARMRMKKWLQQHFRHFTCLRQMGPGDITKSC